MSKIRNLNIKFKTLIESEGNAIHEDLHSDLHTIMNNQSKQIRNTYPQGTFARLFWDEQLKAASAKNPKQICWHPCAQVVFLLCHQIEH